MKLSDAGAMKLPRSLRVVLFSLIALAGPVLRAAEVSNPAAVGFDAARLTRLDAVIQAQKTGSAVLTGKFLRN